MRERLQSYLGKSKGFTLVELLVVIAIIAILVLLVIIALDPLERIRDANDRNAQNTARQLGSAVASCITKEIAKQAQDPTLPGPWSEATCGDEADDGFLETAPPAGGGYVQDMAGYASASVTIDATTTADNICIAVPNPGGHGANQVTFNTADSSISDPETAAGTCL